AASELLARIRSGQTSLAQTRWRAARSPLPQENRYRPDPREATPVANSRRMPRSGLSEATRRSFHTLRRQLRELFRCRYRATRWREKEGTNSHRSVLIDEPFRHLQDTHTFRKLISHLPLGRGAEMRYRNELH